MGKNAQGKSNLLEAIYFISTGKSFRTHKVLELVRWNQQHFSIGCEVEFSGVSHKIEAQAGVGLTKYLLDGKPRRGSAIFGNFKAVIFASEDLDIVRGEPSGRRRFFDHFFSQVDSSYAKHLDDYQHVVKSRNALLAQERFGELAVWNDLLIREGSWLVWRRKNLLKEFEGTASNHHRVLAGSNEELRLSYKTLCDKESVDEIARVMGNKLVEQEPHERILKSTLVGPHRDDFEIFVQDEQVRHFGSEGQKRSVMLSLRMAQWKFLGAISGDLPMILLDDVMGELDEARQASFLNQIVHCGAQTFIALTQMGNNSHSVIRSSLAIQDSAQRGGMKMAGDIFYVRQGVLEHETTRAATP